MANHSATKKSIRQTMRRTQVNKKTRSLLSTLEKNTRGQVQKKDKTKALHSLKLFSVAMDRSVSKGLVHVNKAARKKSRLALLVNTI